MRYHIYGPDLDSVLAKDIAIPLVLPWKLERYILDEILHQSTDSTYGTAKRLLIPIHDPFKYAPTAGALPSLQNNTTEQGNIRYWIISAERMWKGQKDDLDIIADIFTLLALWFMYKCNQDAEMKDDEDLLPTIAEYLLRRVVSP